MFHGFKKTKGVISIFLVIILVPMLTASSLFVDVSKMVLAHSVAESAADLALNTVLTHYDKELNEYFGLIASAQSMDEAYKTAKDFFVSCMKSQEISEEDASNLTNALNKYLFSNSSEGFSDFLGIYTDEDSLDVEPIKNGNLANPAVFKTQVVEFMKYRGPINAVTEFFSFLKSNSEQLSQMDEITEMTEKKQEFYEAESGLMQTLYDLYKSLKEYDACNLTAETLRTVHNNIKHGAKYEGAYREIHKNIISNAINTEWYNSGYEKTSFPTANLAGAAKLKSTKATVTSGDSTIQVSVPDVQAAANALINAYKVYKDGVTTVLNGLELCGALESKECVYHNKKDQIHDIQYFGIVGGTVKGSNLFTNFQAQVNAFERAYLNYEVTCKKMKEFEKNYGYGYSDDISLEWQSDFRNDARLTETECSPEAFLDKATTLRRGIYGDGSAVALCKDIDNHLATIAGSIIGKTYTDRTRSVANSISKISEEIKGYKTTLDTASKALDTALVNAGNVLDALNGYKTGLDNWDSAANKASLDSAAGNGSIVETDRDEIATKRSNKVTPETKSAKLLGEIKEDEVNALVTRLTAIKARIDFLLNGLDCCIYIGNKIEDLGLEQVTQSMRASKELNTSSFMKKDVQDNINAFDKLYKTYEDNEVLKENIIEANADNNPKIENGQLAFRDKLYKYFEEAKKDQATSGRTEENAKEDKGKLEKAGKAGKEDSPDFESGSVGGSSDKEISKESNLPSKGTGDDDKSAKKSNKLSEVSNFVTALFKDFKATASSAMVNLRDDLLFSDYVMSMFSYDTFEREGVLDYAVKEGYELSGVLDWKGNMSSYSGGWSDNADPTFHYNKTLRNNPINNNTCFSYGNEVEYILYGKTNAVNKSKAYTNIYAIRFACNLIPVFKEYWGNHTVAELAASISAATLGIIPFPAVKLLICLGVLAAESAVDLTALREGVGVKFIKTRSNEGNGLFIDVDRWINDALSGKKNNSNSSNGIIGTELPFFRYSDYLRFFLILKLLGSGEDGVCRRTADVVQVNMKKSLGKESTFALAQSKVYFKINANVKVRPLMLSLSINASEANPYTSLSELASFDYEMIRGY